MDGRARSRSVVLWTVTVPRPIVRTISGRVSARLILASIGWRSIRSPRRLGRYNPTLLNRSGLWSGRDRRLAHVDRSPKLGVGPCNLHMLPLNRYGRNMSLSCRSQFLRLRRTVDSTIPAVIADPWGVRIDSWGRVVNVVNHGDVHVIDRGVVEKAIAIPTAAFITFTEIAKAVEDPAVKTYLWPPVAVIENVSIV